MPARGSLVALSAGAGQVASDNVGGSNGLYTRELVKAMQVPGLPLREVFFQVRRQVYEASSGEQFPEVNDQLLGDITLRPARVASSVPASRASQTSPTGGTPSGSTVTDNFPP